MMCVDSRADKLKEMDDVVWEHANLQLNLSSMVEPIMTEARCSLALSCLALSCRSS